MKTELKKEETFMVQPIDNVKALAWITEKIAPQDNHKFSISIGAIVGNNVEVDDECCYNFMPKKFINGKIQHVLEVGVRIITIMSETQRSIPTSASFYIDIPEEDYSNMFTEQKSLKEHMGRRYDYNPRIKANMLEFIEDIVSQIPA